MKLISLAFGKFPNAIKLHSRFMPDSNYLKITLDLVDSELRRESVMKNLISNIRKIFPRFDHHQCCNDEWSGFEGGNRKVESNFRIGNISDDIPHLLEHILIDTVATVGCVKSISGVTGGYYCPVNRYDIFVECPDKKLGIFSLNFCMILMQKLMNGKKTIKLPRKFSDIHYEDLDPADSRLSCSCKKLIEKLLISPIPVTSIIDKR